MTQACSNPAAQWQWAASAQGAEISSVSLGSPLRLATWPNCKSSVVSNGTELAVGSTSKSICPGLKFRLTPQGRVQMVPDDSAAQGGPAYCLAIPPHASAKLFECGEGGSSDDEQRFVWKAAAGKGTLALAAGCAPNPPLAVRPRLRPYRRKPDCGGVRCLQAISFRPVPRPGASQGHARSSRTAGICQGPA
jgi:hypothetical protein